MLLALTFASFAFSQLTRGSSAPPPAIQDEFSRNFPDAEEIQWNSPRSGYSASFFLNGYPMLAFFSPNGEWESTRISIPESQVPKPALLHYEKNYTRFRITNTFYHDATGNSYYCIFVSQGSAKRELHYTDNGEFIKAVNR